MVEFQQEEAARRHGHGTHGSHGAHGAHGNLTPEEQANLARRHSLELARARAAADLARATVPAHRKMLEQAIAALDEQLSSL